MPADMVLVPHMNNLVFLGGWITDRRGGQQEDIPAFAIGRDEVMNGEFKEFVDAGGYDEPRYWAGLDFHERERRLPWTDARKRSPIRLGALAPQGWRFSTYARSRPTFPSADSAGTKPSHSRASRTHRCPRSIIGCGPHSLRTTFNSTPRRQLPLRADSRPRAHRRRARASRSGPGAPVTWRGTCGSGCGTQRMVRRLALGGARGGLRDGHCWRIHGRADGSVSDQRSSPDADAR